MNEELIQFPPVDEIKAMLAEAREDIQMEAQDDPESRPLGHLLLSIIAIIEEKIDKRRDLNKLSEREKIDLAAHIAFLNSLEDDFFYTDDELEDFEYEEVELDEEPHKKK